MYSMRFIDLSNSIFFFNLYRAFWTLSALIPIKTDKEMNIMRQANRIIAIVLTEIQEKIKPGVSTLELDQWASSPHTPPRAILFKEEN